MHKQLNYYPLGKCYESSVRNKSVDLKHRNLCLGELRKELPDLVGNQLVFWFHFLMYHSVPKICKLRIEDSECTESFLQAMVLRANGPAPRGSVLESIRGPGGLIFSDWRSPVYIEQAGLELPDVLQCQDSKTFICLLLGDHKQNASFPLSSIFLIYLNSYLIGLL